MSALGSVGGNHILAISLPAQGQTVKTKDKTQRFSIYNFHQHIKVCNFLEASAWLLHTTWLMGRSSVLTISFTPTGTQRGCSNSGKEKLQQTLGTVSSGHGDRHRKHLTPHGNMTPRSPGLCTDTAVGAKLGFQKTQGWFLVTVRELY